MPFDGRVLVVDDEPHIRRFLALILRRFGQPTIVEAGNGEQALAEYRAHKPDLVLMDVNMPVLDGMQALETLMKEDPDATVIMLTSLATRNIVERCVDLGAVNFIRKDTPKETISTVIGDTLASLFPSA